MLSIKAAYLPSDRLQALISGTDLPQTAEGSTLFADISGFTSVTERFRQIFGTRRGAEELAGHLNRVYDALVMQVDRHSGSIMGFAGDAITCWFNGEASAIRSAACGFALIEAMRSVEEIVLPDAEPLQLGLKVVITTGTTKRFIVGNPEIQLIDALAGTTVALIATGEELAQRGELLADGATVEKLGDRARVREWRGLEGQRFAVLESLKSLMELPTAAITDLSTVSDDVVLPWMLPALNRHLQAGLGEFQIELRPVTALFLRFATIAYDEDPQAREKLDQLIRLVQRIVDAYEGNVLQLTIGDKGSYLYAAFGAPYVHEDDPARALNAAIDIRDQTAQLGYLEPVKIGISRGIMRTGAYGGETRRTYGVLGDEVNLAARLMSNAQPGTILISESMLGAKLDDFALQSLSPIQVKGKSQPIQVFQVSGRRDRTFEERFYTTLLIGRDDELKRVQEALRPILERKHAGVIYIHAEAGMGKSRLAFELQQQLQDEAPVTWLIGQANQLNRTPLSAFAYFLRPYFGQRREHNTAANLADFDVAFDNLLTVANEINRAELLIYRSFLAGIVGLVIPGSDYETADEKLRIDNSLNALKVWVRAESTRQPIIIQLEDAHWLDVSSIRAVQQLTYNMDEIPLGLVLTNRYNDDGTAFTLPNIYSVPVHNVDLNRLSDNGVRALVSAVLNGRISEALAEFVRKRAEGNPFFTEQLILDLRERNALVESDSSWDVRTEAAAEVPEGVNAVLIARLDRLASQVKVVVHTASVLGREFEIEVLSRMLREADMPSILEAEREAIWSALSDIRYLFRHALLRDAAYAMQAQQHLKRLHQMAAEAIETLYPNDVTQYDVLLEHWQNAQVANKILYYTVPVCERLVNVTADYAHAERLLEQALTLGETPFHANLLSLLGDVARLRGQYEPAVLHYQASLTSAGEDGTQRIRAFNGLGSVRMTQGNNAEASALIEQGLVLARQYKDQKRIAGSLTSLGHLALNQGDNDVAQAHFSESLRIHREIENHAGIINALQNIGIVASIKSAYPAARTYLEESYALASKLGYRQRMGSVLDNLGTTALQQGDYQAARSYYERSLIIRREIGDRNGLGGVLGNLAILAIRQGNLTDAQTYGESSLEVRRAMGDKRGISNTLGILASIALDQNERITAQNYYTEVLEMQRAINDRWGMATTLINMGQAAGFEGHFTEAQAHLTEGLTLYRQLDQPLGVAEALDFQGDLAIEQGELTLARELYQESLNMQRIINDQRGIPISLMSLAYIDTQLGRLAEAENQLNEALVLFRELDLKDRPRALALLAVVKIRLGQSSESISILQEALALVQAKKLPLITLLTLIETTHVLFAIKRYIVQAELIGLLLKDKISNRSRLIINQLLDDLRPLLDPPVLDEALERGRLLDLDTMIERLLLELG